MRAWVRESLELGDFVDKLGAFCHRDLQQGERAEGERGGLFNWMLFCS